MNNPNSATVPISVKVLPQTKAVLQEQSAYNGLTFGEIIDRLMLDVKAKTPEVAAQLILDDISIHICNLDEQQTLYVFAILLATIKKCLLTDTVPEMFQKLVQEVDEILKDKGVATPTDYF